MKNATLGKVFGWLQFAVSAFGSIASGGLPHGALGWTGLIGSLVSAIGIHAASNTNGTN